MENLPSVMEGTDRFSAETYGMDCMRENGTKKSNKHQSGGDDQAGMVNHLMHEQEEAERQQYELQASD